MCVFRKLKTEGTDSDGTDSDSDNDPNETQI